jgi:hypothetical protein
MRSLLKVCMIFASLCLSASVLNAAIPAGYAGTPFTGDTLKGKPQQVPGDVKAVFFDMGGEGVAYHDGSAGNTGGTMRPDPKDINVDMQPFIAGTDYNVNGTQEPTGSWHLSWIDLGDWFKCTLHIKTAGTYTISLHEAVAGTPNTQTISFNDGTPDTVSNLAVCTVPPGCPEVWHAWNVFQNAAQATLDSGLQVMKFTFVTANFNFDKLTFTLKSATAAAPSREPCRAQTAFNIKTAVNNDACVVSFVLAREGPVRLSVLNCKGMVVARLDPGIVPAGNRSQTVRMEKLARGAYFVRVEQAGAREIKPFVMDR